MDCPFDLETIKSVYSSFIEFICSKKEYLKISNNVSNIWKTTDQKFLRLMGSFFIKQQDPIKSLVPSSKLYSDIVSFCEKNNNQEFLKWTKGFNNYFISSVAKNIKKCDTENNSSFDFNENLRKCSDLFHNLKMRNDYLEKTIIELQNELKLSQEKNSLLTSSLENLADEECENFRKRMRTKIFQVNVDQSTTV